MKLFALTFISLIALFSYTNANSQTDTTKADTAKIDTVKGKAPAFTNADVMVETEWGTSEKTENVKVFVFLEAKHPHLILMENKHKQCELRIVKGITIKIYDRKTGKLLKTYSVEN